MIEAHPAVYLISEPVIDRVTMLNYLYEVGGQEWFERVVFPTVASMDRAGATELVEFCGRLCYRSWKPGLNENVTRVRTDTAQYLTNLLTSGHGSVFEHAHFTFALHDVSRVVTAELNRHRQANISEQSFRFVRSSELRFRVPPGLKRKTQWRMRELVRHIEQEMLEMYKAEELDHPDASFEDKKVITSAIRRVMPQGVATEQAWTANLRQIRHVIETRTAPGAEEEIRLVAHMVGTVMKNKAPFFFQDYDHVNIVGSEVPAWVTTNVKV